MSSRIYISQLGSGWAGLVPRNVKSDYGRVDPRDPIYLSCISGSPVDQGTSCVHHAPTCGSNAVARWACAALVSGVRGLEGSSPTTSLSVAYLPTLLGINAGGWSR